MGQDEMGIKMPSVHDKPGSVGQRRGDALRGLRARCQRNALYGIVGGELAMLGCLRRTFSQATCHWQSSGVTKVGCPDKTDRGAKGA